MEDRNSLKTEYAKNESKVSEHTLYLNRRLYSTYGRIAERIFHAGLSGVNLDLGCGDGGFSQVCAEKGIESIGVDYPATDLENDPFPQDDASVNFVTMNAVIEHIANPSNVLSQTHRVLKSGGLVFIRTPNWQMDSLNFYNDPTHVKPYSPASLQRILELHGFSVPFVEPGLVECKWLWWQLPEKLKWRVAKRLRGGTKSILAVGQKN